MCRYDQLAYHRFPNDASVDDSSNDFYTPTFRTVVKGAGQNGAAERKCVEKIKRSVTVV